MTNGMSLEQLWCTSCLFGTFFLYRFGLCFKKKNYLRIHFFAGLEECIKFTKDDIYRHLFPAKIVQICEVSYNPIDTYTVVISE